MTGAYRARATTLLGGGALPRTIGYVGVRAEQAFTPSTYWGVEANGAIQSGVAGYAEYLGTFGAETELVRNRVNVGARIAVGMGGGGAIPTAGGLLAKAAVYGVVRLSPEFGLALEAGVTDAPRGSFRAAHASAALVWALDGPSAPVTPATPTRTDFTFGVERFDALRKNGTTRSVHADTLKVNRFITPEFYFTGQIHSAIVGGAGGYSAAVIGGGWTRPIGAGVHIGAELLGGASGGGGMDSRGVIVQPMAYLGYQINPIGGAARRRRRDPLGAQPAVERHVRRRPGRRLRGHGRPLSLEAPAEDTRPPTPTGSSGQRHSGERSPFGRLALAPAEPLERRQRLPDDLVHVVVAVGRQPPDEGDVGQALRPRLRSACRARRSPAAAPGSRGRRRPAGIRRRPMSSGGPDP